MEKRKKGHVGGPGFRVVVRKMRANGRGSSQSIGSQMRLALAFEPQARAGADYDGDFGRRLMSQAEHLEVAVFLLLGRIVSGQEQVMG